MSASGSAASPVAHGRGVPAPSGAYVDAHVHFWDPARFDYPWLSTVPALNRRFLPGDLSGAGAGPDGVIAVEADRVSSQAPAEAGWLRELGRVDLPVIGVVAHADVDRGAGCSDAVARLASMPLVAGVRRLLQDQRPGFATGSRFVAGVRLLAAAGLPFDLCIRRHQLAEATDLVRRLPEVGFVLDHLGKPEISLAGFRSWAPDLRRLSALPNVRCKLSGLGTEADPDHRTTADLLPFLHHALDAFGPERCMFGSDWPVLTLAMGYGQWLDIVREATTDLTADERDLVMRRTAQGVYGVRSAGKDM